MTVCYYPLLSYIGLNLIPELTSLFLLILFSSKFILADSSWIEVLRNSESYSICTTVHRALFLSPCSLQSFITNIVAGHSDNGLHSKKVGCVFELINTPFIWNLVLWGKEIQCGFFSLFWTGLGSCTVSLF